MRIGPLNSFFVVFFVLLHRVLFVLDGRFRERVRLRLFLLFLGVLADLGRLDGVVRRIALLESVADIDGGALSALGDGDRTGPSQGLDHIHSVADGVLRTFNSVLLGVADNLANPGGLLSRELGVLTDVTEAFHKRVLGLELVDGGLLLLCGLASWLLMGAATHLEKGSVRVGPSVDGFQFVGLGEGEFFRELDLVGFLVEHEESLGGDGSGVEDSSKSRTKETSFVAEELRVGVNVAVEVTGEDVLNQASLLDVLRSAVWELSPVVEKVVSHPEDELVDAFTATLNVGVLGVLLSHGKSADSDPVVFLGSEDLAAEAESLSTAHDSQALK